MSLRPESLPPPYQPIGWLQARRVARVEGIVRSVRRRSAGAFVAIDVELEDSSGRVTLEFLGRLELPELSSGASVVAQGVPLERDGELVILNPWYACRAGQDAGQDEGRA